MVIHAVCCNKLFVIRLLCSNFGIIPQPPYSSFSNLNYSRMIDFELKQQINHSLVVNNSIYDFREFHITP